MDKKLSISIGSLLMFFGLFVFPLSYTGTGTFFNIAELLLCLTCCYITGSVVLAPAKISNFLLSVSNAGFSIFVGALLFSLLVFISVNPFFLIGALTLVTASLAFIFRASIHYSLKVSFPSIFAFFVTLLVFSLISTFDFLQQSSAGITKYGFPFIDPYYFTSIVTSIRTGTIFSASYEVGSPINYQCLGFLPPALFADILKISSHQALWGLAQPFYKFLAILLCYDVSYFFVKDKLSSTNYFFIFLCLTLPLLLAPLRPVYILTGNVNRFVYSGVLYLLPSGFISHSAENSLVWPIINATWPISIVLSLSCLLLFFKSDWKNKRITADKLYFTLFMSLLIIAKVPMFGSFVLFVGAIMLKRVVVNRERLMNYFPYCFFAMLVAGELMHVCMGQSSTGHIYIDFWHFKDAFTSLPLVLGFRNTNGLIHIIKFLVVLILSYCAWISIRWLGLMAAVKSDNSILKELLVGSFVSILGTSCLAAVLHLASTGIDGKVNPDPNNDLMQFVGGSFYMLTIVSSIGLLYFLYSSIGSFMKKSVIVFTAICTALSLAFLIYAFIYCADARKIDCMQYSWYQENVDELKTGKYNDGLIVVNPHLSYYGIMLAASDYGKYWSAMDKSKLNFNGTNKNAYRWALFQNLLGSPDVKYLIQMKSEGVKYIFATPADSAKIAGISTLFPQQLDRDTKWIYRLK